MGIVYKAIDTRLHRMVALKFLTEPRTHEPEALQRFEREARAASALNHPNICTIYDVGEYDRQPFLVMECLEGQTLQQHMQGKRLKLQQVLDLAVQMADGLNAAHQRGIIHRDIKPANIFITDRGQVKILDFGLAKLREPLSEIDIDATTTSYADSAELTEPHVVMGTTAYMSPEQAQGKPVDARSDIFSFGSVLYEMCGGRQPFSGKLPLSVMAAVISQDPLPLHEIVPDVPAALERAVVRCLRKDPARRFQSMLDLKLTLEKLRAENGSGPQASVPKRRVLVAAGIAVLVVTLLGLGAWIWWRFWRMPVSLPLAVEQITFDGGLTTDPAISPDGKLIAYASDRTGEGNLDIWVQYLQSEPVRVTNNPADESQPSFSPDGTQIAYRSEQEGGGIYVVSSLGGGEPRLIVKGGARPRFSPDGTEILFSDPSFVNRRSYTVSIVAPGAQRKEIAPEHLEVAYPLWSPDGRRILFWGWQKRDNRAALFVISKDGGKPEKIRLDAPVPEGITDAKAETWLPDNRIIGEAVVRGRTDLWQAELAQHPWRVRQLQQLTFGTGTSRSISAARDGTVVLSSEVVSSDLWSLPADTNQGRMTGEPLRLTEDSLNAAFPSISLDGTKLTYSTEQNGKGRVWIMDLRSGARRLLTSSSSYDFRPVISSDGERIVYVSRSAIFALGGLLSGFMINSSGGSPEKIYDLRYIPWGWSNDNQYVLVMNFLRPPISIDRVSITTHQVVPFLRRSHNVYQSHISHDGRWVIAQEPGVGILLAPMTGANPPATDHWKVLFQGNADLVRWSPDDNLLYFISSRDSFRCIWAQRLQPDTKQPVGDPFAVAHFHQARRSLRVADSGKIGLAIARDKIVVAEFEDTGNIWTAKLPTR
ncbi:MAG: PD40 domain-containing protein [Acidobacteriaceae bacterium]|nr:PD40 domain-containing protein [Acidobacteriaceae bacterium]